MCDMVDMDRPAQPRLRRTCGMPRQSMNLCVDESGTKSLGRTTGLEQGFVVIPPAASAAGLLVVIVAAVLLFRYRDRILAWRASRIRPGTVVWAMVPFNDGRGQKDRPILILGSQGRSLDALKLTTQSKVHRRDCLRIGNSTWDRQRRQTWLDCG